MYSKCRDFWFFHPTGQPSSFSTTPSHLKKGWTFVANTIGSLLDNCREPLPYSRRAGGLESLTPAANWRTNSSTAAQLVQQRNFASRCSIHRTGSAGTMKVWGPAIWGYEQLPPPPAQNQSSWANGHTPKLMTEQAYDVMPSHFSLCPPNPGKSRCSSQN